MSVMNVAGNTTVAMPRSTETSATKPTGKALRNPAAASPSGGPSDKAAKTCGAAAGLRSNRSIGTIWAPATKNKRTTSTGIVDEIVEVVVSTTGAVVVVAGTVVGGGLVVVALSSYGI
jgi:hypothetical protein